MTGYQGRRRADRTSSGHGHAHAHAHGAPPELVVAPVPRIALLGVLAAVGVAVVVGLIALWPSSGAVHALQGKTDFAAPGTTFPHGTVRSVQPACPPDRQDASCGHLQVEVDGTTVSVPVAPEVSASGLAPGDRVQLQRTPAAGGGNGQPTYGFYKVDRGRSMWLLAGLFALVVIAVARLRGLLALVALSLGVVVIALWLLPSLLSGHDPVLAALVAAAVILYAVLYLTHGLSLRTSAALAGTLGGLAATALLGLLFTGAAHLSGVGDEGGTLLTSLGSGIDFQRLMTATVVIAGLGVLNDVTITQASAVWELRAASDSLSRRQLWTSAMRIGRDHIASTIYTIVFAYAGTALLTLLLVRLYDRPLWETLGTESMAEEVVRSLVSAVGLVLAVPITTAVATAVVPSRGAEEQP